MKFRRDTEPAIEEVLLRERDNLPSVDHLADQHLELILDAQQRRAAVPGVRRVRRRTRRNVVVAIAIVVVLLVPSLAMAGALPAPIQRAVSKLGERIGVDVPEGRGKAAGASVTGHAADSTHSAAASRELPSSAAPPADGSGGSSLVGNAERAPEAEADATQNEYPAPPQHAADRAHVQTGTHTNESVGNRTTPRHSDGTPGNPGHVPPGHGGAPPGADKPKSPPSKPDAPGKPADPAGSQPVKEPPPVPGAPDPAPPAPPASAGDPEQGTGDSNGGPKAVHSDGVAVYVTVEA